ncbi:methyltransferase domain-containing protein [Micromonospora sp. DH15]|nr:methyltransferase domain-containing protein [Micromonospora sp. DH15]
MSTVRVGVRCDAGPTRGVGHLVRCLAAGVVTLAVVDGDTRGQDADVYLDQNLGAAHGPLPGRLLAGTAYPLLRDAVVAARPAAPRPATPAARPRVLAFFGGTDAFGAAPVLARVLLATEAWPPNVEVARRNLRAVGARVLQVAEGGGLPVADAALDLVVSRHPVHTPWDEIARVLRPGGTFLSQQIRGGTMRELSEAMLGPLPPPQRQLPGQAVAAAEAAGLTVLDLREARLRTVFHDVAAVVYFLRKVVWTVPGFTVERYRPQLARLHDRIEADGPFVAHARRFLIEAVRPA